MIRILFALLIGAMSITSDVTKPHFATRGRDTALVSPSLFVRAIWHYEVPRCAPDFSGNGLLVIYIRTTGEGGVEAVDLDKAASTARLTDSPIARAILTSVKKWRVHVPSFKQTGKPAALESRVYFYINCSSVPKKVIVPGLNDVKQEQSRQ